MTEEQEIKYMSWKDFQENGYLQEANRQFFHPLGLALEIEISEDESDPATLQVWDYREDPEGMSYFITDKTKKEYKRKAENIKILREEKLEARNKMFDVTDSIQKYD